MDMVTRGQILDEAVCISQYQERDTSNYSLRSYEQIEEQNRLFNFVMATNLGKEMLNSGLLNSTEKLTIFHILFVEEGFVKHIHGRNITIKS